jgi:hypothetical protein
MSIYTKSCNDLDGDEYGDAATSPYCTHTQWDCDDSNPNINSGKTEILHNGIDDDCNAATLDNPGWGGAIAGAGYAGVPGFVKESIVGNLLAMVALPLGFMFFMRISRKRR